MAYQAIGRGTSANDGTGDDLRSGAGKINANFVEVYTKLGDGSTLTTDTVTLNTATQTLTNKTLTAPTITGAGAIAGVFTGNITGDVTGNVTGNVTGDLTGDVTGNVTGNVTGDLTGNVTGNVTGNADTATSAATLTTPRTIAGVSFDGSANITIASTDLSDTADIVLAANTITLTNKTLTAPIIGGDVTTASGNLQLNAATNIVEVKGDGSATEGQIILNCETNAHGQTIKPQPHSAAVTNTMLLPDGADSTLVSEVATQTLTNKSLTSPTITGTGAIAAASVTTSNHFQAAVYADTSARDAAITSPAAGMVAYLTATNKLQVYTGSAWETITSA